VAFLQESDILERLEDLTIDEGILSMLQFY
jgi:hypothetical protein